METQTATPAVPDTEFNTVFTSKDGDATVTDLISEFQKPTIKDEFFKNNPPDIPPPTGPDTAPPANEDPGPGKQATTPANVPDAPRRPSYAGSKLLARLWNFITSILCAIATGMEREIFNSSDRDVKDIADAIYEYEESTGKAITSPAFNLTAILLTMTGEKVYKAYDIYKRKPTGPQPPPVRPDPSIPPGTPPPDTKGPVRNKDGTFKKRIGRPPGSKTKNRK